MLEGASYTREVQRAENLSNDKKTHKMKTMVVLLAIKWVKKRKFTIRALAQKLPKKSLQPHSEGLKNMTAREHILTSEGDF